ncbi:hypothetical protein B0H14DRAFT_3451067 [Mycena olivaceomarginata]|nr:hypothetical protein B0H14DRAFT_3451067 [Mycena olivaceomarginata]
MEGTPSRPLRFVYHGSPVSPLGRKRQRLDSVSYSDPPTTPQSASMALTIPALPPSPYRFNSDGMVVDAEPASSSKSSDTTAAMLALDAAAHQITKAVREKEQEDKETKSSYERHIRHYETFWATTVYAKGDYSTGLAPLPTFPITVAKAIIFLEYESTRPQKKRKRKDDLEESGTSVGVSSLKQAISAFENWRLHHQHLYKNIPEAQVGLRTDPRIKAFESAASHKEPEVKLAQSLNAKGSSAGGSEF